MKSKHINDQIIFTRSLFNGSMDSDHEKNVKLTLPLSYYSTTKLCIIVDYFLLTLFNND